MAKSKKLNENKEQVSENTPALDSLRPDSHRTSGPTDFNATRSEKYAQALALMGGMSDEDLNGFTASLAQAAQATASLPGNASVDANLNTIKAHPSAAVKEDIEKLFGEDHTPEFIEKTTTIFESALEARLIIERQALQEDFETKLEEAYEELNTELTDKVDQYLDYAIGQWIEENAIVLEQSFKQEITEEFIEGLKGLFEQHYIEIPEERVDVVAELSNRVAELEEQLNTNIAESVTAKQVAFESEKAQKLASISEGLTDVQKEKLRVLSEQVTATNVGDFEMKVSMIKESAFAEPAKKSPKTNLVVEEVTIDPSELNENVSQVVTDETMKAYMSTMSRLVKKS